MRTSMPPSVATPERDVVHEAAHEEDAPPTCLEEILGSQRVGDLFGLEALSLIDDAHDQLTRVGQRRERELDGYELVGMLAISMLDRVDDRLAHGDADPVHGILVEPAEVGHAIADHLDEVQRIEIAWNLKSDRAAAFQHAGAARPAPTGADAACPAPAGADAA